MGRRFYDYLAFDAWVDAFTIILLLTHGPGGTLGKKKD